MDKFFFKYFGELHPGDVIVFHPPSEAHASDDFIKRLIALPGNGDFCPSTASRAEPFSAIGLLNVSGLWPAK
ncbi:hypothetical protein HMPREF0322_00926 [Desulfitobacterium hafniense DP7]|uniref:Peptidase S26 domain-containing protein n=1 Tax=Desulfitobacterium hafniense DP7 TaxID=537010 RepID=G9XJ00_DESHA|nr:hypothetical protein HMPREF0322_00926 [Desulfitobacterium hafniense DP7]